MFSLMVVDHVRLDSEHIAQNYTVHARAAERLARLAFSTRVVMVSLLAIATATAIASLLQPMRAYEVAAAVSAGAALIAFALYSVFGFEARVIAHRSFAHRLWIVCERYRSLLAEVNDGLVNPATLVARRDELIHELHAIYENGFSVDQIGYERTRLAPLPHEHAA